MAEAVVSFVIERLGDLLLNEAKFLSGVRDEVEEARSELQRIKCFLQDADARTRQGDKTIRYHVAEIREAAYDLEDVVATFALKIASRSDRGRKYILQRFPCILIDLHRVGKEVEKICAKISKSRSSFQLNGVLVQSRDKEGASSSNKRHQVDLRRAFSHNIDSDFVGFDKNIKELVSHLTSEGSLHKVVSICGMGGLGKTTLARKIYFHSDVRHHFDCFAWASVSQNYQARDIWEGILIKLISPTAEKRREIKDMRDDEISQALNDTLKQKKCLVVLDDIWTAEAWDCLKSAFPNVRSESKVLFTTRNRDLASHADRDSILHEPKCLEGNESWELLKKKTFFGTDVTDLEDDKRKQKLAQEMLDHCGGLPLAITVLGGLLSNKQGNEWETLHRNIKILLRRGKISEQEDSNLGVSWVLGLSYDELPYHLKPCFLYLASFPEYFEVRAKELCRLWMAEGFVSDEDVAYECLSELVERCLVQVAKWGFTGRIKTCRLHDLMRDLCLSKAQEENFLQAVDLHNQQEAINSSSVGMTTNLLPTNKVRRLAVYLDDNSVDGLLSLLRNKDACLRSLTCFHPVSEDYYRSFGQAMKPLLRSCHLLRVLKFEDLKIGKLPKEIGDLIHLRLFSLRGSYVEELPSSIRNLRCLQTLDLQLRQEWFEMPSAICELEQMRHLYLPGFWRKTFPFDGLVNLQTVVNAFAKDHFWDGLEKLASLTKLKMNLARDVRGATIRLNSLRSLAIMDPDHSTRPTTEFTEYVKSIIVNCPQVYKLHLEMCLVKLPEEKEFPPNLTKLTLVNTRLEDDPTATLEKLPNLRILVFEHDSFIGTEMVFRRKGFRKLESLSIRYLVHLEEWKVEEGALPSLCRLHIEHCFQLRRIPDGVRFLITLKEIVIRSMPPQFRGRLAQGGEDFYKVEHVPSLVFLDDYVASPWDFLNPFEVYMDYYTPI